jgi:hypothetical protein
MTPWVKASPTFLCWLEAFRVAGFCCSSLSRTLLPLPFCLACPGPRTHPSLHRCRAQQQMQQPLRA